MNYDDVVAFVQAHFTDGLVLVIGSGLSAAEGIPGMAALATHLRTRASSGGELTGPLAAEWATVEAALAGGDGLEAALLKRVHSEALEAWIALKTAELLLPAERAVMTSVVSGVRALRLTAFLNRILKPPDGLPILTPNYDRLIELGCEMAGFHVDATVVGQYAGRFDHKRSVMAACRGIVQRGKSPGLDYFPRAIVLKPHGSFDWYRSGDQAIRCSAEINAERLIITPGLSKYRKGYNTPFDKHRDLANDFIKRAARLLVVGYGFNDDHLQTHLVTRIREGVPTLILVRETNKTHDDLAATSPKCICLSRPEGPSGVAVLGRGTRFDRAGGELWDLGVLTKELLE